MHAPSDNAEKTGGVHYSRGEKEEEVGVVVGISGRFMISKTGVHTLSLLLFSWWPWVIVFSEALDCHSEVET